MQVEVGAYPSSPRCSDDPDFQVNTGLLVVSKDRADDRERCANTLPKRSSSAVKTPLFETEEDAHEAACNLAAVLAILREWDEADRAGSS